MVRPAGGLVFGFIGLVGGPIGGLVLGLVGIAYGQNEAVDSLDQHRAATYRHAAVEVRAPAFSDSASDGSSTRRLGSAELKSTAGALDDISRQIAILPGVAQTVPERNDLIVRGGSPFENLTLVDLIEVPTISHFATQGASGGSDAFLNSETIKEVTFSAGGFGAAYGDRLSSVLAIRLNDGSERPYSNASLSATQFGFFSQGLLGDEGSYVVSVRKSYLEVVFRAYGFGYAPTYWDGLSKITWKAGERDRLSFLFMGAIDRMDVFAHSPSELASLDYNLFSDQHHAVGGLTWTHLFNDALLSVTGSARYEEHRDWMWDDAPASVMFRSDSRTPSVELRGTFSWDPTPQTTIDAGASAAMTRLNGTTDAGSYTTHYGMDVPAVHAAGRVDRTVTAVYVQLAHQVDALRFVLGGRMDNSTNANAGVVLSPRASVSWRLDPVSVLSLSAGRYRQLPPLLWLLDNPDNRSLGRFGVVQVVAGIERKLDDDQLLKAEVYTKSYADYPVSRLQPYLTMSNTGDAIGSTCQVLASYGLDPLVNAGKGYARGIEVSFQKKLSEKPWYGIASISYSRSRSAALDGVERTGDYDQPLIINMSGGFLIDHDWEVSGKFRFWSGRPYTPATEDDLLASRFNSARLGDNHSLDVRVTRTWGWGATKISAYLDVQNVYDKRVKGIPYLDGDFVWRQQEGLGIIPSVGVGVEF